MADHEWLAERFEENRSHLRAVAYRMLGSVSEADDAIQETWLRLSRSDANGIENLGGWLTTVVARVCLDMLRSRNSRREDALDGHPLETVPAHAGQDPEKEALLADSVGLALLVVLDRLTPAERIAFVLHDTFGVSFDEIAPIVGRSPAAARQLASRARRQIQGVSARDHAELVQQRDVVQAFLAALRAGDVEGIVAVLDPNVVFRVDEFGARAGAPREIHGARTWAQGAVAFSRLAASCQVAVVNGAVGLIWAPGGTLQRVLTFKFAGQKIVEAEAIADPERLRELNLGVVSEMP